MSDPATPQGRPAYWSECEGMGFVELREFLDRALDAIRDDEPGDGLPRTKEEFVALADMLDAKIAEERAEVPPRPPAVQHPPGYDPGISSYSRGRFTPSFELGEMEYRLWRLEDDLERARDDTGVPRRRYDDLRQEVWDLRRQIDEREKEERRSWPERYAAHERVRPTYEREVRARDQQVRTINKRLRILARRREFVERIRRSIESTFKAASGVPTRKLQWRLLPPGKVTREGMARHFAELRRRRPGLDFDQGRIDKAMELGPKEAHEEIDAAVEGYIVFTFEHTPSVLMECPRVGNALFVIHRDWEIWSKMTKQELKDDDSGAVVRIPHQGDWYAQVKRELGID